MTAFIIYIKCSLLALYCSFSKGGKTSLSVPLLGTIEVDFDEKKDQAKGKLDKARRYFAAHFSKAVIGVIWMILNIVFFIEHFTSKSTPSKYFFMIFNNF